MRGAYAPLAGSIRIESAVSFFSSLLASFIIAIIVAANLFATHLIVSNYPHQMS
jgi:hypothetical protein